MKLVPKPEGFEFTDKRSDRAADGSLWRPEDAMYDASQEMAKVDTDAVLVCWREKLKDGGTMTHYRFSGPTGTMQEVLLNVLGKIMGWVSG